MPAFYTFYDSDGQALQLRQVDDEIWRFLGKEPDPNCWTDEYHELTNLIVLSSGGLPELLAGLKVHQQKQPNDPSTDKYIRLVQHLTDQGWSVQTGRMSKQMANQLDL